MKKTPNIQVGSVAVVKRGSSVCDPGEISVCYEAYQLAGQPSYSSI